MEGGDNDKKSENIQFPNKEITSQNESLNTKDHSQNTGTINIEQGENLSAEECIETNNIVLDKNEMTGLPKEDGINEEKVFLNHKTEELNIDATNNEIAQKTDEEIKKEDEMCISEAVLKITINSYEDVYKNLREVPSIYVNYVLDLFEDVICNLPGQFLILNLIKDLCFYDERIENEIQKRIVKNLTTKKDASMLINLLINIYMLEQIELVRQGDFQAVTSDLIELQEIIMSCETIEDKCAIQRQNNKDFTRHNNIANKRNLIRLEDKFELDDSQKNEIFEYLERYEIVRQNMPYINGDVIVGYQIIKQFAFSFWECQYFLLNYFSSYNYKNLIISIILAVGNENDSFVYSLFLGFGKIEYFLSTFYEDYKKLKNIFTNDKFMFSFLNTIMALLYEKYYLPVKEKRSFYKQNVAYDPIESVLEKEQFEKLLDDDIVEEMLKFSNHKVLLKNLNDKVKGKIKSTVVLDKPDFDLKAIIDSKINKETKRLEDGAISDVSREDFFKSFLYISQYTVSHFLAYLEILQDAFKLNEEEQETFCRILQESCVGKDSYRKFVCKKIVVTKLINEKVQNRFPELFKN